MVEAFRDRLCRGDLLVGTLLSLPSPEVTEILSRSGLDWLFVDVEHSTMDPNIVQSLLQAAGDRIACVLRLPLNDEIWIKKGLDTGAAGVMIPLINSADDARRAVRCAKYPPVGERSVGIARAHQYGADLLGYLNRANHETVVIVQAEHIRAVENIEEIIAVQGIDAVLVGPYDLSASMGRMGDVEHPEVQAAVEQVWQVCKARGMPVGVFAGSAERGWAYIEQGFTLLAASTDTLMLIGAAKGINATLRG